jgi:SM-20-related protein
MSLLDFEKLNATPLQKGQCDYIIVPEFVRPEAFKEINADFPSISQPGNFHLDDVKYGPRFQALMDELKSPEMRRLFGAKFGFDLETYPPQVTVRRYMAGTDGNIHNDSRTKKLTVLIYFNDEWHQKGGQLRLTRTESDVEDFYAEIPPVRGNLLAFRRNDVSFHGFPGAKGERRSIQMCYVEPRHAGKKKPTGLKKVIRKAFRKAVGLR